MASPAVAADMGMAAPTKRATILVPQTANLSRRLILTKLALFHLPRQHGNHGCLHLLDPNPQFRIWVTAKGTILRCMGRTEAELTPLRCSRISSETHRVHRRVYPPIPGQCCLAPVRCIVPDPRQSRIVLANPHNGGHIRHKF